MSGVLHAGPLESRRALNSLLWSFLSSFYLFFSQPPPSLSPTSFIIYFLFPSVIQHPDFLAALVLCFVSLVLSSLFAYLASSLRVVHLTCCCTSSCPTCLDYFIPINFLLWSLLQTPASPFPSLSRLSWALSSFFPLSSNSLPLISYLPTHCCPDVPMKATLSHLPSFGGVF